MKIRTLTVGSFLIGSLAVWLFGLQARQNPTVKVDVDLTLVNATVLDQKTSRIVTDLTSERFEVWEDKVQQKIEYFSEEDVPLSLGIIFDVSGSMKNKIGVARDSAVTFLKTGNPDDEYFLVEFSSRPQVSQDFTTDVSRLQNHLMFTPGGLTALFDAVYIGLDKLKSGSNTKKALLLITDGIDNHSRYTFSNVSEFLKEQDVQLFAIGIVTDPSELGEGRIGRDIIEELTELNGGRAFFPNSVNELPDICTKIAIEMKNQYMIGYRSTNESKDGKWRRIKLKVTPPAGMSDMIVRGKSGYYAPAGGGR